MLNKYVLYNTSLYGKNEHQTYYIRHVVIVCLSCILSLPFTIPIPWPHEVVNVSMCCTL